MELLHEGLLPQEDPDRMEAGICTEEPGDNCWLQLD